MVLVDTSVWIDHLRRGDARLSALLDEGHVVTHAWILAELTCGSLSPRQQILDDLFALPRAACLTETEFHHFVEERQLAGTGPGTTDVHVLGAACLEALALWTRDRALRRAAAVQGRAYST